MPCVDKEFGKIGLIRLDWKYKAESAGRLLIHLLLFWLPFIRGLKAAFESGLVRSETVPEQYEIYYGDIQFWVTALKNSFMWVENNYVCFSKVDPRL